MIKEVEVFPGQEDAAMETLRRTKGLSRMSFLSAHAGCKRVVDLKSSTDPNGVISGPVEYTQCFKCDIISAVLPRSGS